MTGEQSHNPALNSAAKQPLLVTLDDKVRVRVETKLSGGFK